MGNMSGQRNLREKTVLVIGANGFIGSRLCERLVLETGAKTIGLVRNMGRSARIGRLDMRIVRGSVLEKDLLETLVEEADIVINLLAGANSPISEGTRLAARLARQNNVERFIHMSSAAVYGLEPKSDHATEEAPLKRTRNPYSDLKIDAERHVAREIAKGLRAVSLRPRIVWGPYSPWVTGFYDNIRDGKFCLVDEGAGACNTIFIDNLIDAVFMCIDDDACLGETYFVTDDEHVTWREFYSQWAGYLDYEVDFLSVGSTASKARGPSRGLVRRCMSAVNQPAFKKFLREAPGLELVMKPLWNYLWDLPEPRKIHIKRRLGISWEEKEIRPARPTGPAIDPTRVVRERGTSYTCIDKIKALGYSPSVDFESGGMLTRDWLRSARYIRKST